MYIVCTQCRFGMHVVGDCAAIDAAVGASSPYASEGRECPHCGAVCTDAQFVDESVLSARDVVTLSPIEAHLLLCGMGYPQERDCVAETVRDELLNKKIRDVEVSTVRGTTRAAISTITMVDGTTLFLSGSPAGALVYRIRKPYPYTSGVHT
jgi:hypothetical protein